MRRPLLILALSLVGPAALSAQSQWKRLDGPTAQPLSIDHRSLTVQGPIVSVLVRSPIGGQEYEVQRHEVRCTDLAVRLGPALPYDPANPKPGPARNPAGSAWTTYAPRSDGRATAEAICSVARREGLLRQGISSLG